MTRTEYLRLEAIRSSYQFVGGSWAARLSGLQQLLLTKDPSTHYEWDLVKKNFLVTISKEVLSSQIELCGKVHHANIFEFGPGLMARRHWATEKYFVYDLPEMIALQRWISGGQPIFSSDIATFLNLMRDNSGRPSSFFATWSLSECPVSIRTIVLDCAAENCDFIFLAYQPVFDFIDNLKYFRDFAARAKDFKWTETPVEKPLDPGFYLVGRRNRWA